jgi:hypothetical protein
MASSNLITARPGEPVGATGLSVDASEYRTRLAEQSDAQIDSWASEMMRDVAIRRGVVRVVERLTGQRHLRAIYRSFRAEGGTPETFWSEMMRRSAIQLDVREEALALIKRTRETALVDMQADEVYVSYPAATFPLLPEGQIALAQQFARADEIVEGKKRRIFFHNPSGKVFAQSDGVTGVTVVK